MTDDGPELLVCLLVSLLLAPRAPRPPPRLDSGVGTVRAVRLRERPQITPDCWRRSGRSFDFENQCLPPGAIDFWQSQNLFRRGLSRNLTVNVTNENRGGGRERRGKRVGEIERGKVSSPHRIVHITVDWVTGKRSCSTKLTRIPPPVLLEHRRETTVQVRLRDSVRRRVRLRTGDRKTPTPEELTRPSRDRTRAAERFLRGRGHRSDQDRGPSAKQVSSVRGLSVSITSRVY